MSKEKLSALMDGELDPSELDALLKAVREDDALLDAWNAWRAPFDAIEGCPSCSSRFMQRFSARLSSEPVVVAPRAMRRKLSRGRKILVPLTMAASVAFVGVAVWRVNEPAQPTAVQVAQETESTLRAYLEAHRASDGNLFAEREIVRANFQSVEAR